MANLVVVTGPMAVGKMTVAEELKNRTGYNLMVNHDSIEVSDKIFGFATPSQKEFNQLIRKEAFKTSIKYNESMIFTVVTDFSDKNEFKYLNKLRRQFEKSGGKFYLVELFASTEERLKRNVTEERLQKKKSKQDIEWSNKNLVEGDTKYKLNTDKDEYWFKNHLKINNEKLSPKEVVDIVLKEFKLKSEKRNSEKKNKMY